MHGPIFSSNLTDTNAGLATPGGAAALGVESGKSEFCDACQVLPQYP